MASQFIGLYMRVVLKEPHGFQLIGMVQDVEAGKSLTLIDVRTITTDGLSHRAGGIVKIEASKIVDLSEFAVDKVVNPPAYASHAAESAPAPAPAPTNQESLSTFIDPAILSLGRRPAAHTPAPGEYEDAAPTVEAQIAHNLQPDALSHLFQAKAAQQDLTGSTQVKEPEPRTQDLRSGSKLEAGKAQSQSKKKVRSKRGQQRKPQQVESEVQAEKAQIGRGKGWRQTPILQSTASFQPFSSLKRNVKDRKGFNDNGWASEDVTEEMGDFDFENNLAKFDKQTIFDQMRKNDDVDDESRLVSHNRRARPLTAGGKNLHPTENVLDMPSTVNRHADFWNSEAEVGVNDADKSSSREARGIQGIPRPESRPGLSRRSQSRKASGVVSSALPLSRVNSNQQRSEQSQQPGLYLMPSNSRVEAISTLQMLNLENIAANELGYTEDLMAENAGRGIAEVAITALSDPALKVRFELAVAGSPSDVSVSTSTVVVLASNNKSSMRALAAARHLHNKNINVVVCLIGIERERDLLEDLRRQVQLCVNFGAKVLNKNDFFEHLRKGAPTGGRISVSLIIDALLGLTISFEELRIGDQASVYELMEWANRNEAYVLSVDMPTGIDPSTGKIAIIDGALLFIKPRYVVAIGVPKRGLLEAVTPPAEDEPGASNAPAQEDEWRLFVADLGLGSAVWRKSGTKMRRGVDFGGSWVLEMRYRGVRSTQEYEDE